MFFAGSPDHGACPSRATGGDHNPLGWNFALPHGVPETKNAQGNWRFCGNCHGMFFAGSPDHGVCPSRATGGNHNPLGGNFVLPHPISPVLHLVDFSSEVEVVGDQYTPNSHVTIDYGYNIPSTSDNISGQLDALTDSSGHFANGTFSVPSDGVGVISARGTDNVTETFADAPLIER